MSESTLPSRRRIENSSPGDLRSSTLPLNHDIESWLWRFNTPLYILSKICHGEYNCDEEAEGLKRQTIIEPASEHSSFWWICWVSDGGKAKIQSEDTRRNCFTVWQTGSLVFIVRACQGEQTQDCETILRQCWNSVKYTGPMLNQLVLARVLELPHTQ